MDMYNTENQILERNQEIIETLRSIKWLRCMLRCIQR